MRHDEERPLVARHRDHDGDVVAHEFPRHGDVDALRGANRGGVATDVHAPDRIAPDPGGVHDHVGAHFERLAFVRAHRRADDGTRRVFVQRSHAAVVECHRVSLDRRANDRQRESRIVGFGIEIEVRRRKLFGVHRGHVGERRLGAQSAMQPAHSPAAGEVVHPQCRAECAGNFSRHDAVAGHDRDHEGEHSHQVRRIAQQTLALVQRLVHEGHVALLQIAQSAVDQFAALG